MKQVYKFDSEGKFIEPVIIYPNDEDIYTIPPNCTATELPVPNWKPVFDKVRKVWVETITDEDKPKPPPVKPTTEEQLQDVKKQLAGVLIQNAQKDITISKQATDLNGMKMQNASILLTLAKNGIK